MRLRTETVGLIPAREVSLDAYIIEQSLDAPIGHIASPSLRPAMIVCPGGGYRILADRERLPVALPFMAEGYQTFVLSYSLGEHSSYPNPLVDVSLAVRWVRANTERLGIDPKRIAVMGFSAGGHCAAMLATQWHRPEWQDAERSDARANGLENLLAFRNQPNAAILCYAVTDFHAFPNLEETRGDTSGLGRIAIERVPETDPVNYIDSKTCPTFLWHTAADATVPAQQSIEFAKKLLDAGVPVELHMFERGEHGISSGDKLTDYGIEANVPASVPPWTALAVTWLNTQFGY